MDFLCSLDTLSYVHKCLFLLYPTGPPLAVRVTVAFFFVSDRRGLWPGSLAEMFRVQSMTAKGGGAVKLTVVISVWPRETWGHWRVDLAEWGAL